MRVLVAGESGALDRALRTEPAGLGMEAFGNGSSSSWRSDLL